MAIRRIQSKGPFRHDEAKAATALIYPGHLLKFNSAGKVLAHANEGGKAEAIFAGEDALQGKTVATIYTLNSVVDLVIPGKGSEVNAMIQDEQDIAIGDQLISAGDGTLIEVSEDSAGSTSEVIAVATAACDLTGSNTSNTLSPVRVL